MYDGFSALKVSLNAIEHNDMATSALQWPGTPATSDLRCRRCGADAEAAMATFLCPFRGICGLTVGFTSQQTILLSISRNAIHQVIPSRFLVRGCNRHSRSW